MKHGAGEEVTTVGTTYKGKWERGRKHGQGERRIAHGLVDEQVGVVIISSPGCICPYVRGSIVDFFLILCIKYQ